MLKSTHPQSRITLDPSPSFGACVARNEYHVITKIGSGWSAYKYGASRAFRSFGTRDAAILYARAIARKHEAGLVIHRQDGTVAEMASYGHGTVRHARRLSGLKQITAVVHAGLEALVTRESARRLAALGGSERGAKAVPRRRSRANR